MTLEKFGHALPLSSLLLITQSIFAISARQRCLLDGLESAPPAATAESIRDVCNAKNAPETPISSDVLEQSLRAEQQIFDRDYTLTPHKPSYILPITYNSNPNEAPFAFHSVQAGRYA